MATVKMMQGDSYFVFFDLLQDGTALTPSLIADVEVSVGENLRYQYSTGTVGYDTTSRQWYFRPSQAETLAAEATQYEVIARVKYANHINADVRGVNIGRISIEDGLSEEVI